MNSFSRLFCITVTSVILYCSLSAQEISDFSRRPTFEVEDVVELQSNFSKSKAINLLHIGMEAPLTQRFTLQAGGLSVATTNEDPVIGDLQVFSNVDDENTPLALTVAGLAWQWGGHRLFGGIRRMDEDYFCSEGLSLFTNSSCGAFPTISANHDIALFPNAATGIHYAYQHENWVLQGTMYNGIGYNRLTGRENVFRFCPSSDGLFFLAQGEYANNDSHYFLGLSSHYGSSSYDVSRKMRNSCWTYAEQVLCNNVMLIAAYSHAFDKESACRDFVGIGARYGHKRIACGLFSDYTRIDGIDEWATELTCDIQLNSHLSLQPTMHFINTDSNAKVVGLVRLNFSL